VKDSDNDVEEEEESQYNSRRTWCEKCISYRGSYRHVRTATSPTDLFGGSVYLGRQPSSG